jgi:hypothetical protein
MEGVRLRMLGRMRLLFIVIILSSSGSSGIRRV